MIVVSAGGEYRGETYISCIREECRRPNAYGPQYPPIAPMFEGDSLDELKAFLREHAHDDCFCGDPACRFKAETPVV